MTKKISTPSAPAILMTAVAASRIQRATAKSSGGVVPKGSFASQAQSAASKNVKQR